MGGYIGARAGSVGATLANIQDVTATDTSPEVTLVNNTHEDTDGGREGKVIFKGQQSGGEESTLAEIQASHDGTADDEKGDLIFRTNDGSDGASPTEHMRIDSSGFVGINESAPSGILHVKGTSAAHGKVIVEAGGSGGSANNNFVEFNKHDGTKLAEIEVGETVTDGGDIVLKTTPASGSVTERMRIASTGDVGIATTGPEARLSFGSFIPSDGQTIHTYHSGTTRSGFGIVSGQHRMFTSTGATMGFGHVSTTDGSTFTERMRITSGGALLVGTTSDPSTNERIRMGVTSGSKNGIAASATDTNGGTALVCFKSAGTSVGSVSFNNNNTSFNTSSDYRLKENVTNVSDGITRVKQLAPKRFNWIDDDSNTVVDGFLAHEVQTVVPEAITGAKDAMTKAVLYVDGDELPEGKEVGDVKTASTIDPQNIDQSKLVPLLTAALQEAIAKIEALETKVAALEAE